MQIEKLINYIELAITQPGERFEVKEIDTGTPIILDKDNRIRVVVHPSVIVVTKYDLGDGSLVHEVEVHWDHLSNRQKERMIDLFDVPDELDPEIEETLAEILKGS
jgi:hypothetical protein